MRRTLRTMGVLLAATALAAGTAPGAASAKPRAKAPEMRGMWIASVVNIDWPSEQGLSPDAQRAEFRRLLDVAVERKLNAVFVQVRPTADAFWPSDHEPWSEWLTGEQGRDPGYDPLRFMIDEAKERNLEFHGWFNPYRVAMHDDPGRLVPEHPARRNPDWVHAYGGRLYYDPGIPEVREFTENAILDAVEKYDMDGVHFDDYFYPYPVSGQEFPDDETFERYGGDFDDKADWRRDNVNRLVREMREKVHETRPGTVFGVSPFGIWRNKSSDPNGSDTRGLESYSAIYADTRRWVKEGWVDYIAPQIYWEIGLEVADYAVLAPWWAEQVRGTTIRGTTTRGTGVKLYIGQALYRVGDPNQNPAWQRPEELSDHLTLNRSHPEIAGDIFFSAKHVVSDPLGAMTKVVKDHYKGVKKAKKKTKKAKKK